MKNGKEDLPRNWVAKYSALINKPKVFKDKKKAYERRPKHKNWGDFFMEFYPHL